MGLLLAFAPFVAFALVDRVVGATEGLLTAAAVSAAILIRDGMSRDRTPKILEIGTFILFGGLALYSLLGRPEWSILGVRLCVDAGLLAIVLFTLAIGRPFTLQYARERVPAEHWSSPQFLRTNMVITAAWAAAFAVLAIADVIMMMSPDAHRFGIVLTVVALVAAFKFTAWYPDSVAGREAK